MLTTNNPHRSGKPEQEVFGVYVKNLKIIWRETLLELQLYYHPRGGYIFEYMYCAFKNAIQNFIRTMGIKSNICMLMDEDAYKSMLPNIKLSISLQKRDFAEQRCCYMWLSSLPHQSHALLQIGKMNGTDHCLFSAHLPIISAG